MIDASIARRALIGSSWLARQSIFKRRARNFPFPTPGKMYTTRTDLHVFTCKSYSAYQNILDHLNLWTVALHEAQTLCHANFLFEKCCQDAKKKEEKREKGRKKSRLKEEEEKVYTSPCNYRVIGLNVPLSPSLSFSPLPAYGFTNDFQREFSTNTFPYRYPSIEYINDYRRSSARRLIGR